MSSDESFALVEKEVVIDEEEYCTCEEEAVETAEVAAAEVAAAPSQPVTTVSDCRSGKVLPSVQEQMLGNDMVTFVPYARYKHGNNIHTKSVGYHSDGDQRGIVLKEEISSNSDSDTVTRRSTLATSKETPLNQAKVEAKGIQAFPGVRGPKGKAKNRRWTNLYFLDDQIEENSGQDRAAKGKLSKQDFQELFTHRTPTEFEFHDETGSVHPKWTPFVEVTEAQQQQLLKKFDPVNTQQTVSDFLTVDGRSCQSRWSRMSKPSRSELVRVKDTRDEFIKAVQDRLIEYIAKVNKDLEALLEPKPLMLQFDDGYHRLLCHGIVTFYHLNSWSVTDEATDNRVTIVAPFASIKSLPLPDQSFLDFCRSMTVVSQNTSKSNKKKKRRGRR
eukprot:TRINITY_DN3492_c0_g1_i1.p1 TRINITY_DN3492_c0_g1~~TRINITY_DN3492_c0_g1_i1.p1  ORF type:complete len:387 (+),score=74.20 TRINITY_DN3492_c0_g1_i1:51-1211(+)